MLTIELKNDEYYLQSDQVVEGNHINCMPLGKILTKEKIDEYIVLIKKHMNNELKLFTPLYKKVDIEPPNECHDFEAHTYWSLFNINNKKWCFSLDAEGFGQSEFDVTSEELLDAFIKFKNNL